MIQVTVVQDQGVTKAVRCNGHAMFDDNGTDIVCAAVSMLVINTLNSIEQLTDYPVDAIADAENGILEAEFETPLSKEGELLIQSMILGLTQTQNNYSNRYLEFQIQEVTQC